MNNNKLSVTAIVISVLAFFVTIAFPGTGPNSSNTSVNTDGIVAEVLARVKDLGAAPGPDHYTAQNFWGGSTSGNVRATSTAQTTITLLEKDLVNVDTWLFSATGGATTLTFSASTSLWNLVPKVGQMQKTCFRAQSNNLIFAAATGIDIETASTSATDLTILAGNTGCLTFIREAEALGTASTSPGDIAVLLEEFTNGD